MDFFEWLKKPENAFFAVHTVAIFVLALATEYLAPAWTTFAYPAIIFLATASFMWNYPVNAIKDHGMFSQFLIEMRLLWLVMIGLVFEFAAFGLFESRLNPVLVVAAFGLGLILMFVSHSKLQDNIVKERGFE